MDGYDRDTAARRAGVEPEYLARLVGLGIVTSDASDRFTEGGVRRAQLARTLEEAGLPLEGLATALRSRHVTLDFMESPNLAVFASRSHETFRDVADRTGIPVELLVLIREAIGSAIPGPDDLMREDELQVVPFIGVMIEMRFREQSIRRGLRVMGESLRRMAETEADTWRSDVQGPVIAAGGSVDELSAQASGDATRRLGDTGDQAILAVWHAQQAQTWAANILGGFEKALSDAGLFTKLQRPPAMCFLDITGYTRITQERGDEAAAGLAEDLGRLVNRTSVEHGGRPVKWLGDGVMLYFRDPGPGVVAALAMVDGVTSAGLPPAHVGLHAGPVLFQEGDYFGQTVNLASRIAEYARPGEVLVSQAVVDAASDIPATFTEIGPVDLKGVAGSVHLHAAHRA